MNICFEKDTQSFSVEIFDFSEFLLTQTFCVPLQAIVEIQTLVKFFKVENSSFRFRAQRKMVGCKAGVYHGR